MIPADEQIRKSIIYLLISQAKHDKFIHPNEMRYVLKVTEDLGFDQEVLKEIENEGDDFDIKLPKTEPERMQILYYLLFLTKFDQNISDAEVQFLTNLSLKLAIREDLILELVEVMKQHKGLIVPPEALLSVITKYLN